MNKYDWNAVRQWYLENDGATLSAAGGKFSIPKSTIYARARDEGWTAEKRELKKKNAPKPDVKQNDGDNEKIAALAYAADLAVERITQILSLPSGNETDKSDTKNLKDCVSVLKDLTAIIRNVNDIQTPAQAQSVRIEQEKWELEKSKQAKGENREDIRVVFGCEGDEEK